MQVNNKLNSKPKNIKTLLTSNTYRFATSKVAFLCVIVFPNRFTPLRKTGFYAQQEGGGRHPSLFINSKLGGLLI